MDIQRTACLKLNPTSGQAALLDQTMQAYCNALNYISDKAHEMGNCSNYVRLHKAVYYDVRERFGLPSQITISAEHQVASAYSAMRSNGNGKGTATFGFKGGILLQGGERGRDFRLMVEKGVISVSTIGKRQKVAFTCGEQQSQYFGWAAASATLCKRNGIFYLHVVFKSDVEQMPIEQTKSVIGVDIGMNYLATAIGPDGHTLFVGGGSVKQRKRHYRRVRKGLQAKGTKSAKRTLRNTSGREARFQRDANHVVSKRIVEFATQYPKPVIVLEDLTGIRGRARHRKAQRADFHSWAFYQLRAFVEYKAAALGIPVVTVDPRNTSKACSVCGAFGHRRKHNFNCSCGFYDHADRNAARNIALRFVVHRQVELGGDEARSTASKVSTEVAKAGSPAIAPPSEVRDKPPAKAGSG